MRNTHFTHNPAPNAHRAQVCSDINKPDGQFVLPPSRAAVLAFVSGLPIRKVLGVGKVTEQVGARVCGRVCGGGCAGGPARNRPRAATFTHAPAHTQSTTQMVGALGVATCGQLLEARGLVAALLSPVAADFFVEAALGLGARVRARDFFQAGNFASVRAAPCREAELAPTEPLKCVPHPSPRRRDTPRGGGARERARAQGHLLRAHISGGVRSGAARRDGAPRPARRFLFACLVGCGSQAPPQWDAVCGRGVVVGGW